MERLLPLRVVIVEEAHVVGTGIGAKPRSDAAVVDLRIEALGGVVAGVGRTHRFARSLIALLAQDGLKTHSWIGEIPFPIALDTNPVLGPAACGLICSRSRDVVFGMTGHNAGLATRT